MTKVKQTKARKNGKQSVVSSAMNSGSERKMISAERNGEQRNFPVNIWNHLPEDKEGWKETDQKPADPATKADKTGSKDVKPSAEDQKVIDRYNELFADEAEDGLAIDVMSGLITKRETELAEEADMVDFTVDQEFLDTNPERAKEGLKVGEVIKVKKGGE